MQQDLQVISEGERQATYDQLADLMIDAELKGLILEEDVQKSAQFIYENMEKVKTKTELMDFLQILAKRWDIYQEAFLKLKKEDLIDKVHDELNQITKQI